MNRSEWDHEMLRQYGALNNGAGWVELGPRSEIRVGGRDRVRVLNNFCTADIRKLAAGQGVEAFILSVKGQTLGHLACFFNHDHIELSTVAAQGQALIAHFHQFIVSESVEFDDRSDRRRSFLIAGPEAAEMLRAENLGELPTDRLNHVRVEWQGVIIAIRRTDLLGADGFEVVCEADAWKPIRAWLAACSAIECSAAVLEAVRIEHRIPTFGVDIDSKNLPQEIGRDRWAISFNKGCYLGQETVARLDALGHVNRHWVALGFESSDIPPRNFQIDEDGKPIARVTSSTWSPRWNRAIALAFVRDGFHWPGTMLESTMGRVEVMA